MILFQIKIFT